MRLICPRPSLGLAALLFLPCLHAQNVYVLPASGSTSTAVINPDSFVQRTVVASPDTPIAVLTTPAGDKTYLISRQPTNTVLSLDPAAPQNVRTRISLGASADAAVLTPDGRRLLVLANNLHIINTQNDAVLTPTSGLNVGTLPSDIAVSFDSSKAFILSPSSQAITALSLQTNTITGTLSLLGQLSGITVGPDGLLYVSGTNRVYVVDPVSLTQVGEFAFSGRASKLVISPDGQFGVAANLQPQTGTAGFVLNLITRQISGNLPPLSGGDILKSITPVSSTRALAVSQNGGELYEITYFPANLRKASVVQNNLNTPLSNVVDVAVSGEFPDSRTAYVLTNNGLLKVDLTQSLGTVVGQVALPAPPALVKFATPASPSTQASRILIYNNNQAIQSNGVYRTIAIRAIDANGRPVAGLPVAFTQPSNAANIQALSTVTNAEGLALVQVLPQILVGFIPIRVTVGNAGATISDDITLQVGNPGCQGNCTDTGKLQIVSGNGQLVLEQSKGTTDMVVEALDASGKPLQGTTVTFTVTQGPAGFVGSENYTCTIGDNGNTATCLTDAKGRTGLIFYGGTLNVGASFDSATIVASSSSGNAIFRGMTYARLQSNKQPAASPLVEVISPDKDNPYIRARVGEVLKDAVRFRIVAATGLSFNAGLVNVGLTVTTGLDPAVGPTLTCVNTNDRSGTVLTDENGYASCDLVVGGVPGIAPVSIAVGQGFYASLPGLQYLTLEALPAAVGRLVIVQGNNQTGTAGTRLPATLQARIVDAQNKPLAGNRVSWTISPSTAGSIVNASDASDANGLVSAQVNLGANPGTAAVTVTSGSASATFNLTIQGGTQQGNTLRLATSNSGNNQAVEVNQNFTAPLVVEVVDAQRLPVPGIAVTFTSTSGGVTLSAGSVTTNAQGQASVTARAGATAGNAVVTAAIPGQSVTFSLTVRPQGNTGGNLSADSILNGAGFQKGYLVPGSIVTIQANGVAAGVNGVLTPNSLLGPLPTRLGSTEVRVNNIPAPLFNLANANGQQQVTFQVPFEVAPGTATVTVTVSTPFGATNYTATNVPVLPMQAGIFETAGADGRKYAVAVREDGSYVSQTNPARRGEKIRVFVTGLGQTTPKLTTNAPSLTNVGLSTPIVVTLGSNTFTTTTSEALAYLNGIYLVTFTVPQTSSTGTNVVFSLGVPAADGASIITSNQSTLPIQ